jgi:hypothetical protein
MVGVRSLDLLHKNGSTSRVLNLLRVWENHSNSYEYRAKPLFKSPKLNRALIVKHQLRSDEDYLMGRKRIVATKIIFPIVKESLSFGGQSLLIGQNNFSQAIADAMGGESEELNEDIAILDIIDELPSLDPFLVREILRRKGKDIGECFFELGPKDQAALYNLTINDVSRLVKVAAPGVNLDDANLLITKMVNFILKNEADEKLEPFRIALGLQGKDFKEGIYAWRGFLYFKGQYIQNFHHLSKIITHLERVRLSGFGRMNEKNAIHRLAQMLKKDLRKNLLRCRDILNLYEKAFSDMVDKNNVVAFREFLVSGPKLFADLGIMMGAISHIVTFWNYRFDKSKAPSAEAGEYLDLLNDFYHVLSNCQPANV